MAKTINRVIQYGTDVSEFSSPKHGDMFIKTSNGTSTGAIISIYEWKSVYWLSHITIDTTNKVYDGLPNPNTTPPTPNPNIGDLYQRKNGSNDVIQFWIYTGIKDEEWSLLNDLATGIDSIIGGDGIDIDYTDPKNPVISSTGGASSWLSMINGSNITDYPQMLKGQMMVIKIVDLNGDEVEDGTAVIGGWNGTTVGNNSLLICMEDSAGGDVTVGYKYAIVGNDTGGQAIIQVADYTELTNGNYQDSSVLYVTIDDGKIWKWNASTNQHDEVSSVVAGTLVSASVFEDLNNIVVTPDNSHLYFDTTSEIYYRWNGIMYENILDTPTEKINFFEDISDNPPKGGGPKKPVKKIWANILTGSIWVWNGSQYITKSGGANLTLEQARQNGNVLEGDVMISPSNYVTFIKDGGEDNNLELKLGFFDDLGIYFSAKVDEVGGVSSDYSFTPYNLEIYSASQNFYGILGSHEFNKQGNRKAFAQIADLEDGYIPLPTEGTNGQVLTTDGDGTYTWENVAGGGTDLYFEVTKTQLDSLINNEELVPGALYKITEVETWMLHGDSTKCIYLKALQPNKLATRGHGEFYVPKYDKDVAGYGIWAGELYQKTSGAMGSQPSYAVNDEVIWGGRLWRNKTGNAGSFVDHYNLDSTNWESIPFDDVNYDIHLDIIEYDYENDYVNYRKDNAGNVVDVTYAKWDDFEKNWFNYDDLENSLYNPLKVFQWGAGFGFYYGEFRGVNNNKVVLSILECINNRGKIHTNTLENGGIYNNTVENGQINNNTLENGQIYSNTIGNGGQIYSNTVENGQINNNTLENGQIHNNTLENGFIHNNTLVNNGQIRYNTLDNNGQIYYNTLDNGEIYYNTIENDGRIHSNTIENGRIYYNTLENNGEIYENTIGSGGQIYSNTLEYGQIYENTLVNNGQIRYNTLENNGQISLDLLNVINNKTIQYLLIVGGQILNVDLSSATLVYQDYERTVFKDSTGATKIRYIDGSGNLVVADITD